MALHLSLFAAGIFLLYFGSGWLVNGSSEIALSFSIRPAVLGLTVVAVATSAPELLVSLVAAANGSSGVSVGNILGSNVINIALVLGLSALVKPVGINRQLVGRELPYLAFVSILFWVLCMDGEIDRFDGIVLFLLLVVFLVYSIMTAQDINNRAVKKQIRPFFNILRVVAGLMALGLGAHWVVRAAIYMARSFDLSELFIGISIVAIGTSLPELATSVTAAMKKQSDISVGNVVGSNLFNICLVMGAVGLLNPIPINNSLNRFEFPAMILITLLLYLFAVSGHRLRRSSGLLFIACFFIYNAVSYWLSN